VYSAHYARGVDVDALSLYKFTFYITLHYILSELCLCVVYVLHVDIVLAQKAEKEKIVHENTYFARAVRVHHCYRSSDFETFFYCYTIHEVELLCKFSTKASLFSIRRCSRFIADVFISDVGQ